MENVELSKQMPNYGCLVISLDFELLWGIADHANPMEYKENIKNVWKVVPILLEAFTEYGIHATWGVVGLVMEESIEECYQGMPSILPTYENMKYSSYCHFEELGKINKRYLFAKELLIEIKQAIGQEIGTHTYSHYYCLESGQNQEQFNADLIKARDLLGQYNPEAKSILLPRNQFNEAYAAVLKNNGFTNYRGNENAFFYKSQNRREYRNVLCRAYRLLDNYFPISGNNCYAYDEVRDKSGLNNIRSSRFLRPYSKKMAMFEPLRMERIKKQMEYAAKNKMIFHMWWHPHNFGRNIDENKKNLVVLLDYFSELSIKYNFKSLNMQEVGNIVNGI